MVLRRASVQLCNSSTLMMEAGRSERSPGLLFIEKPSNKTTKIVSVNTSNVTFSLCLPDLTPRIAPALLFNSEVLWFLLLAF